ncbi:Dabb family protein [Spiractinospora alimapuensis]|uniref:Dabb family protein n=1 Tax=Spiractinospora alimapuensis TaxID=2820884 RepID=UPI001F209E54|nr:Dabb family protein [Spiractinospora alimapuensis]QVQ54360.1 Dabb family protein [Spiractinospora alimapuensis]
MGLRHTVLFRWTPEVTENQIAELTSRLEKLPELIDVLRAYSYGPDLGISSGNFDFAIVAETASVEDFVTYRDHPEHQAVVTILRTMAADRAAVQFSV